MTSSIDGKLPGFPTSPFLELAPDGAIKMQLEVPFVVRLRSVASGEYDWQCDRLVFRRLKGADLRAMMAEQDEKSKLFVALSRMLKLPMPLVKNLGNFLSPGDAMRLEAVFGFQLMVLGNARKEDAAPFVSVIRNTWAESFLQGGV